MITSIGLSNFKSWKRIPKIRLSGVTGFFGTNSSGKTSILQALLLMKQSKESTDRAQALHFGNPETYANLGTFRDIVSDHDVTLPLAFSLSWVTDKSLSIQDVESQNVIVNSNKMEFKVEIGASEKGSLFARYISYALGEAEFFLQRDDSARPSFSIHVRGAAGFSFRRNQGRPWPLPGPVKYYGFPDQARTYFQNAGFLADLELAFERQLDSIFYLGPLREFPSRDYLWSGSRPVDVGQRGESAVDALLAARAAGDLVSRGYKRRRLSVEAAVADWLKRLSLIDSFQVREIAQNSNLYQVVVKHRPDSAPVLITDVGFGVSQILPVLVLLHYVPDGSTILLEQPEIHLHPKVQSGLAELFVEVARARNLQIVFESHSEHLLLRLQRLVAEERAAVDELSLFFCDASKGGSALESLDIDLLGNIKNWPPNFFGDMLGETVAIQKAQLTRQQAASS